MTSRRRLALALAWLALLLLAGGLIGQRLELSGDLRKFMPAQDANTHTAEPHAARAADASEMTTIAIQP